MKSRHLGEGEYLEVELANLNEVQFSAVLTMGSHEVPRSLLLDTGSNVLWLTADQCGDSCDNKHSMPYRLEDSAFGKYY